MPLDNRNLEMGTVLHARYKGTERTCEVVHTADGLRYRLDDGTEHKSPSSAGKAAMDGVSCNGWRFWSLQGTEKPQREAKAKADKPAKSKKEPAAKKPVKAKAAPKKSARTKSAKKGKAIRAGAKSDRSVAAETSSYGCGVCGETFPTMKAATQHATEAHIG